MSMIIEMVFIIALITFCYCEHSIAFEMYKKTGSKKYMVAHIVVLCALLAVAVYKFECINVFAELI